MTAFANLTAPASNRSRSLRASESPVVGVIGAGRWHVYPMKLTQCEQAQTRFACHTALSSRPWQNISSRTMVCHTIRRHEKQVNMALAMDLKAGARLACTVLSKQCAMPEGKKPLPTPEPALYIAA